ncbi:MAG: DHH family phosphoesterase [Elainellaceae cyanobacterium]
MADAIWHLAPVPDISSEFAAAVGDYVSGAAVSHAAQLLWQRGIRDRSQLSGFVDPDAYTPTSAFAWGDEITLAVNRLVRACQTHEQVAIWGDFDADGITATAVLWDGLGQFFAQGDRLSYFIPNRLTESHGLSMQGIDALASQGIQLIVTCDTGSTNLPEIAHAHAKGIDVIVTDHHTLPDHRPDVVAIVNPRSFAADHPLAHLSGVAVAYKLVEALYATLPDVPQKPLTQLLDLVAIGLIADLVELKGDCRYLAQIGIRQLQTQTQAQPPTRPGVAELLRLCRKTGDRPTDISFGIGPRINAISRIHGDARFCVELLTSTDVDLCRKLAEETELANSRRKALQQDVVRQVQAKLVELDLSTTHVIVLADSQWSVGVLGLVAGQIAQDYARPTILLSLQADGRSPRSLSSSLLEKPLDEGSQDEDPKLIARGSARSLNRIDLYELVKSQSHLLRSFGGHPFAAGLSLDAEQVPIFAEAINQEFRSRYGTAIAQQPSIAIDLTVTVAELGQSLFRELKLLEPYGMGNPAPRLLIQNCWFENSWHRKINDAHNRKINYIRATFELCDETTDQGFPGMWWGHYKDDIPPGVCDAVVELDYSGSNSSGSGSSYQVRLVDVRSHQTSSPFGAYRVGSESQALEPVLLDWRSHPSLADHPEAPSPVLTADKPPAVWRDFFDVVADAYQQHAALAIAYPPPLDLSPKETWQQLVGIVKHLSRTQKSIASSQLTQQLQISEQTLRLGLDALSPMGFAMGFDSDAVTVRPSFAETDAAFNKSSGKASGVTPLSDSDPTAITTAKRAAQITTAIQAFLAAVGEEQFRQRYFYETPIATLQAIAHQAIHATMQQRPKP